MLLNPAPQRSGPPDQSALMNRHPTNSAGPVLLAAMMACAGAASAAESPSVVRGSPCQRVDVIPVVQVPLGKSTVLTPRSPVARIILGNPENARAAVPASPAPDTKGDGAKPPAPALRPGVADVDVLLLGPNEVYLLGKTLGSTNVVMIDRARNCTAVDVVVTLDATALQSTLAQLLPHEKDIKVGTAFDSVVLSGNVSDPEALTRAVDLATAFVGGTSTSARTSKVINMLEVAAPQQVMLEVKVAEISKTLLDQFGIDFSRAFVSGDGQALTILSGILGGATGALSRVAGAGSGSPYSSVATVVGSTATGTNIVGGNVTVTYDALTGRPVYTTSYGTVPGQRATGVNLNMQKNDGLVKVLAEPSVLAISGQTGSFLAGGKIFIPVAQTSSTGGTTVTLEEKEFGVSLKFTPTVLGNGAINLRVRPEVSELNSSGVTITGFNGNAVLPAFTSRKAETTVQLKDGQSFAIGGLIKNNSTTSIKAFPFLGELPLIGALFRSTEFQTDRSELVFVITPRLVKPLPADYRLPTDNYVAPSRSDLILRGRIEGRRADGDAAPVQNTPPATSATPPAGNPAAPSRSGGFDTGRPTEK